MPASNQYLLAINSGIIKSPTERLQHNIRKQDELIKALMNEYKYCLPPTLNIN